MVLQKAYENSVDCKENDTRSVVDEEGHSIAFDAGEKETVGLLGTCGHGERLGKSYVCLAWYRGEKREDNRARNI